MDSGDKMQGNRVLMGCNIQVVKLYIHDDVDDG